MLKDSFSGKDMTIVICAYKECPTLEKSIQAICCQTVKTLVKISTSTPNDYILKLADQYGIEVCVNPCGGHVQDYNYALMQINTPLGMLAHQDDILCPEFVEKNLIFINRAKRPILAFSDYLEMHNDTVDLKPSAMIRIKRLLTWPIKLPGVRQSVFAKRLLLCLGNPITHPTVVCVMKELPSPCFNEKYRASMDWDLWERLSRKKGEFVYVDEVLLYHRMSSDNSTSIIIKNTDARYKEDFEIMSRFWPKWLVRIIMLFYKKAQKYY